jgi:hypothetical protein
VSVATGRVREELAELIGPVEQAALQQAIIALLKKQFAHLGQVEVQKLVYAHSSRQVQGVALAVGSRYLVNVRDGRVTVNTRGRARKGEARIVEELQTAITGLLTGLAGLVLQQKIINQVREAGYQVTGETRAPNGAIVIDVEV